MPSAPVNVGVTGADAGLISLAWDPPKSDGGSPVTGYIVEVCNSTESTWQKVPVDGSVLSLDLTDLKEGDFYFIRVFAKNEAGVSKRSGELDDAVCAKKPISM